MSQTWARVELSRADGGVVLLPAERHAEALSAEFRAQERPLPRRRRGRLVVPYADAWPLAEWSVLDWTPEALRAVQNRQRIAGRHTRVLHEARRVASGGPEAARARLQRFGWATELDDHQLVNVAALTLPEGWGGCVFDEQGTGKTPTMIAAFDVLHAEDRADVLLVVAPKSMAAEWVTEVDRFTDSLYRVGLLIGSRSERAAVLNQGNDVLVINYEAVASLLANLKILARRARVVLAVDESFFVKNHKTERSAALMELREWCERAYVLCGTPAPNAPHDLVAQVDLVDFGMTFDGVALDVDRAVAGEQVRRALADRGFYLRNLKREALPHLPPRRFSDLRLPLAPVQQRAYAGALQNLLVDVREATETGFRRHIASFMERRAALLRICSNPGPLLPGYDETPAKLALLDSLLPSLAADGEKVVVWSFYRHSLEELSRRYGHLGLVRIDGSVTEVAERRAAVERFQHDPDVAVFVGNPAAAGAGLTLHAARIAVYESLSNQAAHYLQSLDRIHRRGQSRDVEYVTLVCQGTIEEVEYERLLEKARRQADLLGDPPEARVTQQLLLDELEDLQRRIAT